MSVPLDLEQENRIYLNDYITLFHNIPGENSEKHIQQPLQSSLIQENVLFLQTASVDSHHLSEWNLKV